MSVSAGAAAQGSTHIHCQPERPILIDALALAQAHQVLQAKPTGNAIHLFDTKCQQAGEGA